MNQHSGRLNNRDSRAQSIKMPKTIKSIPERKSKSTPAPETFSLISNEKLVAIYSAMVKCRMLQQRASLLFQHGKLASDLHASYGCEAVAAALAVDLQPNDTLSLSHGDLLPGFVKGLSPESLFRLLTPDAASINVQKTSTSSDLKQKNILTADESRRPEAVRKRATAAQATKEGAIVAAILPSDDGWLDSWHGVMATAASQRLPILFVHHVDHRYEPSDPSSNRKAKNPDALFHGVPAIAVDALDAVAVYRVAYEAIIRARQGRGATLLQCAVHSGMPDKATHRISEPSANPALTADPVSLMENYLKRKGIKSEQHNSEIVAALNHDLDLATRFLDH
jgi:TPP-dependent pyruvate/acetoin dehydrogenase alpha subunit